jgi:hypothetical protein
MQKNYTTNIGSANSEICRLLTFNNMSVCVNVLSVTVTSCIYISCFLYYYSCTVANEIHSQSSMLLIMLW